MILYWMHIMYPVLNATGFDSHSFMTLLILSCKFRDSRLTLDLKSRANDNRISLCESIKRACYFKISPPTIPSC